MSKTITVPLNEWQDLSLEIERLKSVNKELVKGKVVLKVSDFNLKAGIVIHNSSDYYPVFNHPLFRSIEVANYDNLQHKNFDFISKESHFEIIEQYKLAISENLSIKKQDITQQDKERSALIGKLERDLCDTKAESSKFKSLINKLIFALSCSLILNFIFVVMQ